MLHYRDADRKIFLQAAGIVGQDAHRQGMKLLDIGCGNGVFTLQIAQKLGIDIEDIYGMEAIMETHIDSYGGMEVGRGELDHARSLGIRVVEGDLNKGLPFQDGEFDIITANQVLEHVWKIDFLLQEIHRVLKKDGIFVVGVPNLASLHERISLLFGYNPSTWHTADVQIGIRRGVSTGGRCHVNGFTVSGFNFLLKYYGFLPIKKFVSEVYFADTGYIPLLSKIFPNFALSQAYICKKQ